jgi:hypothetical protein
VDFFFRLIHSNKVAYTDTSFLTFLARVPLDRL